jgi:GINS complex subunit 3
MNSYYSIDAILTDAYKVPCTFKLAVPGLGYLDDNAGGDVRLRPTNTTSPPH